MAWIESHTVLMRHRKVAELARLLRLRRAYVVGHLHSLWHAALEQQDDGDLSAWSDEFIAEQSDFSGDAPQWVRLLQQAKFLDGKLLHDWPDYAGRFLTARYHTADPDRLCRIWAKHGRKYGSQKKVRTKSQFSHNKGGLPNQPNPTVPTEPTKPTQPNPDGGNGPTPSGDDGMTAVVGSYTSPGLIYPPPEGTAADDGDARDPLEREVNEFIRDHSRFVGSQRERERITKMVRDGGWELTRRAIDLGIRDATSDPLAYASTVVANEAAKRRLSSGDGSITPAKDWKNKKKYLPG